MTHLAPDPWVTPLAQVEVKSLEAGPGVTKHVYVMEPDVPGGSSVHPSLLGLAHVRGDKEVGPPPFLLLLLLLPLLLLR